MEATDSARWLSNASFDVGLYQAACGEVAKCFRLKKAVGTYGLMVHAGPCTRLGSLYLVGEVICVREPGSQSPV